MMRPDEVELVTAFTWRTGRKLGYDIEPAQSRMPAPRCRRQARLCHGDGTADSCPAAVPLCGGLAASITHQQRLKRVQRIARMMDDQFVLPGTVSASAGTLLLAYCQAWATL
jgi:hypothetical protein